MILRSSLKYFASNVVVLRSSRVRSGEEHSFRVKRQSSSSTYTSNYYNACCAKIAQDARQLHMQFHYIANLIEPVEKKKRVFNVSPYRSLFLMSYTNRAVYLIVFNGLYNNQRTFKVNDNKETWYSETYSNI